MSEKDKAMLERINALPQPLRDRFVDKIEGAAMAIEALQDENEVRENDA